MASKEVSISEEFDLEEFERDIAIHCKQHNLGPARARSIKWDPFSDRVIDEMMSKVESTAFFMPMVEAAIIDPDMYERTNFPMELLRRGVQRRHSIFDWPRFRAAAVLYAPFIRGITSPEIGDMHRLSLDMNIDLPPASIEKDLSEYPVPQSMPGLGNMIASKKWPVSDLSGLREFFLWASHTTDIPKVSTPKWFERVAKVLEIRIAVVDLTYRLESPRSLVKHLPQAIAAAMETKTKILSEEIIKRTFPFEFPPSDMTIESESPYKVYGSEGPLSVVLDYGYGENRYLPLLANISSAFYPSTISPDTLWKLNPVPAEEDLHIVEVAQYIKFISAYMYPNAYSDIEELPDRTLPDDTNAYMKTFMKTLFEFPPSTIAKAYMGMYVDKIKESVIIDASNGLKPFSARSETSKLMDRFELSIHRLSKNE